MGGVAVERVSLGMRERLAVEVERGLVLVAGEAARVTERTREWLGVAVGGGVEDGSWVVDGGERACCVSRNVGVVNKGGADINEKEKQESVKWE